MTAVAGGGGRHSLSDRDPVLNAFGSKFGPNRRQMLQRGDGTTLTRAARRTGAS